MCSNFNKTKSESNKQNDYNLDILPTFLNMTLEEFNEFSNIEDILTEHICKKFPKEKEKMLNQIQKRIQKVYQNYISSASFREHQLFRKLKFAPKPWLTNSQQEILKKFNIQTCKVDLQQNNFILHLSRKIKKSVDTKYPNECEENTKFYVEYCIMERLKNAIIDFGNFNDAISFLRHKYTKTKNSKTNVNKNQECNTKKMNAIKRNNNHFSSEQDLQTCKRRKSEQIKNSKEILSIGRDEQMINIQKSLLTFTKPCPLSKKRDVIKSVLKDCGSSAGPSTDKKTFGLKKNDNLNNIFESTVLSQENNNSAKIWSSENDKKVNSNQKLFKTFAKPCPLSKKRPVINTELRDCGSSAGPTTDKKTFGLKKNDNLNNIFESTVLSQENNNSAKIWSSENDKKVNSNQKLFKTFAKPCPLSKKRPVINTELRDCGSSAGPTTDKKTFGLKKNDNLNNIFESTVLSQENNNSAKIWSSENDKKVNSNQKSFKTFAKPCPLSKKRPVINTELRDCGSSAGPTTDKKTFGLKKNDNLNNIFESTVLSQENNNSAKIWSSENDKKVNSNQKLFKTFAKPCPLSKKRPVINTELRDCGSSAGPTTDKKTFGLKKNDNLNNIFESTVLSQENNNSAKIWSSENDKKVNSNQKSFKTFAKPCPLSKKRPVINTELRDCGSSAGPTTDKKTFGLKKNDNLNNIFESTVLSQENNNSAKIWSSENDKKVNSNQKLFKTFAKPCPLSKKRPVINTELRDCGSSAGPTTDKKTFGLKKNDNLNNIFESTVLSQENNNSAKIWSSENDKKVNSNQKSFKTFAKPCPLSKKRPVINTELRDCGSSAGPTTDTGQNSDSSSSYTVAFGKSFDSVGTVREKKEYFYATFNFSFLLKYTNLTDIISIGIKICHKNLMPREINKLKTEYIAILCKNPNILVTILKSPFIDYLKINSEFCNYASMRKQDKTHIQRIQYEPSKVNKLNPKAFSFEEFRKKTNITDYISKDILRRHPENYMKFLPNLDSYIMRYYVETFSKSDEWPSYIKILKSENTQDENFNKKENQSVTPSHTNENVPKIRKKDKGIRVLENIILPQKLLIRNTVSQIESSSNGQNFTQDITTIRKEISSNSNVNLKNIHESNIDAGNNTNINLSPNIFPSTGSSPKKNCTNKVDNSPNTFSFHKVFLDTEIDTLNCSTDEQPELLEILESPVINSCYKSASDDNIQQSELTVSPPLIRSIETLIEKRWNSSLHDSSNLCRRKGIENVMESSIQFENECDFDIQNKKIKVERNSQPCDNCYTEVEIIEMSPEKPIIIEDEDSMDAEKLLDFLNKDFNKNNIMLDRTTPLEEIPCPKPKVAIKKVDRKKIINKKHRIKIVKNKTKLKHPKNQKINKIADVSIIPQQRHDFIPLKFISKKKDDFIPIENDNENISPMAPNDILNYSIEDASLHSPTSNVAMGMLSKDNTYFTSLKLNESPKEIINPNINEENIIDQNFSNSETCEILHRPIEQSKFYYITYLLLNQVILNSNINHFSYESTVPFFQPVTKQALQATIHFCKNGYNNLNICGSSLRFLLGLTQNQWKSMLNILKSVEKFKYKPTDTEPIHKSLPYRILCYFFKTLPKFSQVTFVYEDTNINYGRCVQVINNYYQPIQNLTEAFDSNILNVMKVLKRNL